MSVFKELAILDIIHAEEQDAKDALDDVGMELHAIIVQTLSQPGSGATYPSRGGGGEHQASAPGEPPAVDLGVYRGAWKWEMAGEDAVDIYTEDDRGPALEFGSKNIEPRPHVRPSVEKLKPIIGDIIARRASRSSGGGDTFSGGGLGAGGAGEVSDDLTVEM